MKRFSFFSSTKPSPKEDVGENDMEVEIEENERYDEITKTWSYKNLLPTDPKRFRSSAGLSDTFPDLKLSPGFVYKSSWQLDYSEFGIVYGVNFKALDEGSTILKSSPTAKVRRRRWIRSVATTSSTPSGSNQDGNFAMEYDESDIGSEMSSEMGDFFESPSANPSGSARTAHYLYSAQSNNQANNNVANNTNHVTLKITDPSLAAIGKQIRFLENEIKKIDEMETQDWKKTIRPKLETEVTELSKQCEAMKRKIEKELDKGVNHICTLEEELTRYTEALEIKKKRLHLPKSAQAVGQDGVYVGFDDIWLEFASGFFILDLVPDVISPQMHLVLSGTRVNPDAGTTVRLKVVNFKLVGDKGKGIPKINFDNLKVTVGLGLLIGLLFDVPSKKWSTSPDLFQLNIISFKGPYGISRSIVSAIMSLVTPIIRRQVIQNLPHELGMLLKTLPSPFCVRGEFEFTGMNLNVLSTTMHKSSEVCALCEYSTLQVEMFYYIQKALERSTIIKTMTDLMLYCRFHSAYRDINDKIVYLWRQACIRYSERVIYLHMEWCKKTNNQHLLMDPKALTFKYDILLEAAKELQKKRIVTDFKLHAVDGQISLNHLLGFVHDMVGRLATESMAKANPLQKARLLVTLDRIRINYESGLEILKLISKNLDFAQLKLQAGVHAGPQGIIQMVIAEIFIQAPILLQMLMASEASIGYQNLVPLIVKFKPQENGNVFLEMYHFIEDDANMDDASTMLPSLNQLSNEKDLDQDKSDSDTVISEDRRSGIIGNEREEMSKLIGKLPVSREGTVDITAGIAMEGDYFDRQSSASILHKHSSIESNEEGDDENEIEDEGFGENLDEVQLTESKELTSPVPRDRSSSLIKSMVMNAANSAKEIASNTAAMSAKAAKGSTDLFPSKHLSMKKNSSDNGLTLSRALDYSFGTTRTTNEQNLSRSDSDGQNADKRGNGLEIFFPRVGIVQQAANRSSQLSQLSAQALQHSSRVVAAAASRSSATITSGLNITADMVGKSVKVVTNRRNSQSEISTEESSAKLDSNSIGESQISPELKQVLINNELQDTLLQRNPKAEKVDTILVISASSPQFSMIVDQTVTLKPGAELFTVALGYRNEGWAPFGSENMLDRHHRIDEVAADTEAMSSFLKNRNKAFANPTGSSSDTSQSAESIPTPSGAKRAGCPIKIQTSPGIKFLIQIPKTDISINLAGLIRFLLAHFVNVTLLKLFLEAIFGGEFFEDQLLFVKRLIEKSSKYLLFPGLDIDININGRIVSRLNEIMLSIETPQEIEAISTLFESSTSSNQTPLNFTEKNVIQPCAIKLKAELFLQDIIDDHNELEKLLKQQNLGEN